MRNEVKFYGVVPSAKTGFPEIVSAAARLLRGGQVRFDVASLKDAAWNLWKDGLFFEKHLAKTPVEAVELAIAEAKKEHTRLIAELDKSNRWQRELEELKGIL